MAYFLQGYLPGDWISKLAFVELLMWVAMLSMVFLGRHENKDEIKRLTAVLAERDAEIAALKPQPAPLDAEIAPQALTASNGESEATSSDAPLPADSGLALQPISSST